MVVSPDFASHDFFFFPFFLVLPIPLTLYLLCMVSMHGSLSSVYVSCSI